MFKRKTIVLSVCGVFSMAGCASLSDQADWRIEPSYGVKHSSATPEGMYRLGRYYKGRVRYDKAIAAYRAALEQDPNFADAHSGLGVVYAWQGRYEDAIRAFQSAIAIAPQLAYVHNNLGYAYLLQGSNEKAVNALEEARRLDPGNERVLHNLKLAHQSIEKGNAARSLGEPMIARASTPQSVQSAEAAPPVQARSAPDDGVALAVVAPNIYELREQGSSGAAEPAAVPINRSADARNPSARASTAQSLQSAEAAAPAQARSIPDDSIALVVVAPNIYELRDVGSSGAAEPAAVVSVDRSAGDKNPVAQVKPFALEVSNGNGITGMAQRVANWLARMGVKTALLTNQLPYQQASTQIQYRDGYRAEAVRLGSAMHMPTSIVENDALRNEIQVRLVLGLDVPTEVALFEQGESKVLIAEKPFRLEVSNGNGIRGMAQRTADRLERIGVKTVRLTNELPFQRASTEIFYREGYRAEAARLGGTLRVPMSVVDDEALRNDIHVRLVLGRDTRSEAALFESSDSPVRIAAKGDVKAAR
ncbi:MAG: LytR C-terminal domain-containing protein [Betaproteobacteria bacterium]|nr:LytR C-terminal domain-containing protein [Betaproteobacteria bacterium]